MAWALLLMVLVCTPAPAANPPDRSDAFTQIAASDDVPWLEKLAGSLDAAARELQRPGGLARHAKDVRTAAYARLGEIGSDVSLVAVDRIETAAKSIRTAPATVPLDVWTHPCWHFADAEVRPIARGEAPDGTTCAIVPGYLLGRLDLFLITSRKPNEKSSWTRPMLVPINAFRGMDQAELTVVDADTLELKWVQGDAGGRGIMEGNLDPPPAAPRKGPQTQRVSLKEIRLDTDGDGWTDLEEARLGLDPKRADTDGDGRADGEDVCPDFAPPVKDPDPERTQILQRAVFATFGLSGSRDALFVNDRAPRVQLWGCAGPVLSKTAPPKSGDVSAVIVGWDIRELKGDHATVIITDYEGPLAAGAQDVVLRKINGQWYVIARQPGPVS